MKENNTNYIWDNNFSVRFKIGDGKQLQYIPNNIYMVELPSIVMESMNEEKNLTITLRCTADKTVEKEVYTQLMNNFFDVEISVGNANSSDFLFSRCSVSKIEYAPLMHRSNNNFFNIKVQIKAPTTSVFYGEDTAKFGNDDIDYMTLVEKDDD